MSDRSIREQLIRHWLMAGVDEDGAHEIYLDDAVLEFPQSGERFVGRDAFLAWRKQYPAKLDFRIRRLAGEGNFWVAENLVSYDGGPWMFAVSILQFRDGRVAHERVYVSEGWDPAEWRRPWAEYFDPLEGFRPEELRDR